MVITNASGILVKGKLDKKFFWFCVKRRPSLILYLFINFYYYILSILLNNKDFYIKRKFRYYNRINNIDATIQSFKNKLIYINYFNLTPDCIIEEVPKILLEILFPNTKVIGYKFDRRYNVDIAGYNEQIKKAGNYDRLYANKKTGIKDYYFIEYKSAYVVNGKRCTYYKKSNNKSMIPINIITIFVLANIITVMSFFFTTANLDIEFFKSYFEIKLYLINFIPIFLMMIFIYVISSRVYVSFLVVVTIVLLLGISNQTKLTYRDDIVKFEDLLIIKEALIMSNKYDIIIKKYTIMFISLLPPTIIFLRNKLKIFKIKWYIKISVCIIILFTSIFGYKYYSKTEMYEKLGNESLINVWIITREYQIRGLVYPFIYTIKEYTNTKPENYDEKLATEILNKYTYENIPEDKKVNVIAIMFEAFNDFSKFKEISFTKDIYKKYHEIEKESLSGSLITQIYGGGTVITERNFLTGYYHFPSFRKITNSYVWYFKEQGYNVDAMHPIYGAFYNRASININLGFDHYYNYENRYKFTESEMKDDNYFLNDIISEFKKNKETGKPYFNFAVTYQNHGPYKTVDYPGKPYYIKKKNMSDDGFNIINEYFKGLYDTIDNMFDLIEYFKKEKEPTIIIMFGDHNPYLGENQLAYNELGINMDTSTVEGFRNYYSTPYLIYGNPSAKKVFNKSFIGKGEEISPIFLMNEVFEYIGLSGNEYMQYTSNIKKTKPVMSTVFEKENGKYISAADSTSNSEYEIVSYYVANNFKYNK